MEEGPQSWAAPGIRGSAVTLNVRAASRGTMALSLSLLIFSVLMCEGLSSAASGAAAAPSVPTTSWAVAAQREIALEKDGREAFSSTGALLAYLDEGNTGAFDGLLPPPNQTNTYRFFMLCQHPLFCGDREIMPPRWRGSILAQPSRGLVRFVWPEANGNAGK